MQAGRALLFLCSCALLPAVQSKHCTRVEAVGRGLRWTFDLSGCATLNLSSNSIGAEGAQALAEALKTNGALTTLDLSSEALKTNVALTTLNLRKNSIGDEGALALAEALKTNGALTTLGLRSNSIGYEAQAAVDATLAVPPEERPGAFKLAKDEV